MDLASFISAISGFAKHMKPGIMVPLMLMSGYFSLAHGGRALLAEGWIAVALATFIFSAAWVVWRAGEAFLALRKAQKENRANALARQKTKADELAQRNLKLGHDIGSLLSSCSFEHTRRRFVTEPATMVSCFKVQYHRLEALGIPVPELSPDTTGSGFSPHLAYLGEVQPLLGKLPLDEVRKVADYAISRRESTA